SVTSRASTSRRHRSSRSHHGTPSSTSQNEFPIFEKTGDVEIFVTSINGRKEQRYLLHRLILTQSSGFFEVDIKYEGESAIQSGHASGPSYGALSRIGENDTSRTSVDTSRTSTDSANTRRVSSSSSSDRKRWRYVLDWGNTPDSEIPMLVQRQASLAAAQDSPGPPPVSRNKPPASSSSFFRSMSNFSALNINGQPTAPSGPDDELVRDYDNLFRIFYNYPPALDSANIATAYTESKALLHLADAYDALDVVGPRIDHHLLRFQGRLFKQIAKYPPSYLKLAYLAKSKVIFAEALIHIVGQWPIGASQLRGQVDLAVMDLIEDKVDELEEIKAKIETKLFRLTLTTSRGERVNPGNSFLDWLAMSLFRQFISENTTPGPVSIPKDPGARPGSGNTSSNNRAPPPSSRAGRSNNSQAIVRVPVPQTLPPAPQPVNTGRIYRLMGSSSNSAYLPHDEMKRFLKLSPDLYTRDNLRRFERRMDELKNLARDVVKPLTRNCLELDLVSMSGSGGGNISAGGSLGYLTCTRVLDEDFPWD
ncbi:hypothetical protein BDV97DRAFT_270554, partial [Delphinella strobiligena]